MIDIEFFSEEKLYSFKRTYINFHGQVKATFEFIKDWKLFKTSSDQKYHYFLYYSPGISTEKFHLVAVLPDHLEKWYRAQGLLK